ncbi:putative metalloendopeptidase KNAG_0E01920 [Huiozyma naganishii CBS 8797]|uniref:Jacalin-type lectin domain-containing protein n=1 Tax=Huiozyma naganishii (strain ATCC MYA-139 / BCRC 22969 / CBS 8797 / KCTC 17520 / NBRC 10181 / NCYC 3082 / Yp74L-3) TaxID=1071383 RepID=J7S6L0_HUIN7|nr:hypothetical protein KNAG_0E01920 [Kazachstania naganishii CBS 8797]CCK70454.1 hypothetical protein KNAG_0E01920 [Kazachstania naganishii CBS 8797]
MGSSGIEFFNLKEKEHVVSPCVIIHGKCSQKSANAQHIQVQHPQLPTLNFPINANIFKATVLLSPGENRLVFVTDTGASKIITCVYTPMLQNKPVHLCLIVAKDSPLKFDSPASQIRKEGGNGIDLAIRKLRIGARIMQAFTNEQMLRNGFGQRTFNFVEEYALDTQFKTKTEMRNTVKIHVLNSDRSLKEIRDANVAQQNPKGNNTGALFSWAFEALDKYGGPFAQKESPIQAACIYLDTHWDGNMILGHAALGGGSDNVKLAIFGSHGLYSWPTCIEEIVPYFLDDTKSSTQEVANDCNECGSHWECLTVTLGAFMHEIGHSFGSPHQVDGVMLRDYTRLNRSFLTKEAYSTRTNSHGAPSPIFPKEECGWNRMDLLRYLFHPSFAKDTDYYDHGFFRPSTNGNFKFSRPTFYALGNDMCRIYSQTGIYCIEVVAEDLARGFIEYLPKSLGGTGLEKEVYISLDELRGLMPPDWQKKHGNDFKLRVLAANAPDLWIENLPESIRIKPISMAQYGFGSEVNGMKSELLGSSNRGTETGIVPVDVRKVIAVRVYHGAALDGIRFFMQNAGSPSSSKEPPVPPRTYLAKMKESIKTSKHNSETSDSSVLFGVQTPDYTDIVLEPNEIIAGFNVRYGAWVDAIQIITSHGRMTDVLGKTGGGGPSELKPPSGQVILGLFGTVGRWVDSIGIVYGTL